MITLVFAGDLKYCPYIKRYIERLEIIGTEYQVAFWNRGGYELKLPANYHYYDAPSELSINKFGKAKDFIGFYNWINGFLAKEKPKKIIALSTLSGILCSKYIKKSKCQYVYDIRDYSYEHFKPYYKIEKWLIKNSFFTAISSKGFQSFLPAHDYVVAHNFNREEMISGRRFEKKKNIPLKIVWNGVMRFFEYQKLYIDALKNDERFIMYYHGDGPELDKYMNYCKETSTDNVVFTGGYTREQKQSLLNDADIINNAYGYLCNAGNKLKYAVSNRFYDGAIFHVPQFVENEGYKRNWGVSAGIAIGLPIDNHFADNLYQYYQSIDETLFSSDCEKLLKQVIEEDNKYIYKIDEFCH